MQRWFYRTFGVPGTREFTHNLVGLGVVVAFAAILVMLGYAVWTAGT